MLHQEFIPPFPFFYPPSPFSSHVGVSEPEPGPELAGCSPCRPKRGRVSLSRRSPPAGGQEHQAGQQPLPIAIAFTRASALASPPPRLQDGQEQQQEPVQEPVQEPCS